MSEASTAIAISPLKAARLRRGLSLNAAARLISISKGYLSELEHARANPSLVVGMQIAHAYGAHPSTLWPEIATVESLDVLIDGPSLGPLAILSERQRVDLAIALLMGTGFAVSRVALEPVR